MRSSPRQNPSTSSFEKGLALQLSPMSKGGAGALADRASRADPGPERVENARGGTAASLNAGQAQLRAEARTQGISAIQSRWGASGEGHAAPSEPASAGGGGGGRRVLVMIGDFDDLPALTERLAELFDTMLHFATWAEARPTCREASRGLIVASPSVPRQDRFELSRLAPHGLKRLLLGVDDAVDRVVCLNMGADEALATDIELHEICARARRIFRSATADPESSLDAEWLASRSLRSLKTPTGVRIGLSPAEWSCLAALAEHPDRLITVEMAARHIQGLEDAPNPDSRLRMQMSRLRRRLAPHFCEEPIISVYGSGYALAFTVRLVD